MTAEQWRNVSGECEMAAGNFSTGEQLGPLLPCHTWEYDTNMFTNTIVQRFDLVCENKIMTKIASFVFFGGTGVGVFLAGLLADRIGRKRTLLVLVVLFMASGVASALAPSLYLWMAAR